MVKRPNFSEIKKRFSRANLALFSLFVIAIYIGIIVIDVRIPVVNPPDQLNELSILRGEHLIPANQFVPVDCWVVVYLRYYGTLVTGKEVTLSAVAYLESPLGQSLTRARISFGQSLAYPPKNNSIGIPDTTRIDLVSDGNGKLIGNSVSIYFPTSGDYSFGSDFTNDTGVFSEVPIAGAFDVHIEPASILIAERFNRATMGISLALIYFAFLEAYYLWVDHKKSTENRQEKMIQEIEKLIQRLDRFIQKDSQNQYTQTDQTKKKHEH